MHHVSPAHLNSILFESKNDSKWDDFLLRQEESVKAEARSLAGLGQEKSFWQEIGEAIKNLIDAWNGRISEEELTEASLKDQLLGITVAGLKLPEGLLKLFDIGVNFATAVPAMLAGSYRKMKDGDEFIDDAFRPFLVATVGAGAAQQAIEVFALPANEVTVIAKLIWGAAFVLGAIRGLLRFKLDTASFVRNIRRSLNNMRDAAADIEVTKAPKPRGYVET